MKSTSTRRRLAVLVATAACGAAALAGAAGPAAAQGEAIVDVQSVLCEPEGSTLRPTGFCEVEKPGGFEHERYNPYTPDGTSPGLLGLRVLGVL